MTRAHLTAYKRILAIRDGKECFYCGEPKPKHKLTIEHVLSVVDGGSNHINNLVLACPDCNKEAGAQSVAAKIKMRDRKRSQINVNIIT